MTAVAAFRIDGHPVLLGDVLVSGPTLAGQPAHIPTLQERFITSSVANGTVPTGLKQKIVVVSERLVIGWTGIRVMAQGVIKDLIERERIQRFTAEGLMDYLHSLDDTIKDNVAFIGYIADEKRGIGSFGWGWYYQQVQTARFGKVTVAGFATEDLEHWFQEELIGELKASGELEPIGMAVAHAVTLSGYLLKREIDTGRSLEYLYGGGYEIATLSGGKFVKLDDITHIFWNVTVAEDGSAVQLSPHMLFKYAYAGDVLTIHRAEIGKHSFDGYGTPTAELVHDESPYLVEPLCRLLTQKEKEELQQQGTPDMNSRFVGNYLLIQRPGHDLMVYTKMLFGRSGAIQFQEDRSATLLTCDREFLEGLVTAIYKGPPGDEAISISTIGETSKGSQIC